MKNVIYIFCLLGVVVFSGSSCEKSTSTPKNSAVVSAPEWSKNATIYELNVRQFSKEGTFQAVIQKLPELKSLGVDIIWLMPIHPIGEKNRKGSLGSYYAVQDYQKVNPEFGTDADFKALVDSIHAQGMYVIIDWVANHTAWDNWLIESHPDWYTTNEKGDIIAPVEDWSDVADLNYDNQAMRSYMIESLLYWVSDFDIDGYRCDVASWVPTDFWKSAIDSVQNEKTTFWLAEAESPELIEAGFHMDYGWDMHHHLNSIAQGKKHPLSLDTLLKKEATEYPPQTIKMNFTSNHDENSWNGTVFERMGESAETFAALTYTLPGMPLIYNGQEAGMDKRLAFFEKDLIDWKKHSYRELYTRLNTLKETEKALWNAPQEGNFTRIFTPETPSVYAFMRHQEESLVIAIFNLSDETIESVQLTNSRLTGEFKDIRTEENMTLSKSINRSLEPWEWVVLVKE